jgi:hypothetical protein
MPRRFEEKTTLVSTGLAPTDVKIGENSRNSLAGFVEARELEARIAENVTLILEND